MTYAFIDTNLLLHFKVFEGLNWKSILHDDDYTLVVCPTVLDEIDKHKDHSKGKVRNRAKKILKILSDYLDGNSCNGVKLIFCKQCDFESSSSDFNRGREDDYIIAAAKNYDVDGRKVIVSYDIGMKFRANQAQLDFIMPEDSPDNMLNPEPTDEEKKIKELEREIAQYKNRRSHPTACFRNGDTTIVVPLYSKPDYTTVIEDYKTSLIAQNQPFEYVAPQIPFNLDPEIVRQLHCPYSDSDIEEYNSRLQSFIQKMLQTKQLSLHTRAIDRCVTELKFSIFNHGTAPTGKMGVQFLYPEELIFMDENAYIEVDLTPPEKPKLMTTQDKQLHDLTKSAFCYQNYDFINHGFRSNDNLVTESHWSPNLSNIHSSFIELPSLNHNLDISFDIPDRVFVFAKQKGEFKIKWVINDESNIEPIIGELTIRVE